LLTCWKIIVNLAVQLEEDRLVGEPQEEWRQEIQLQEDQWQQLARDDQEEQPLDLEQQQLPEEEHGEEQQQDGAEQPIYAELEPRAPLPEAPVRRPRSRRGRSDPQLPTRSSGRFRGPGDEPLASLPYTGRPI